MTQIPEGFKQVTKEEFFELLTKEKRDVHVNIKDDPYRTWFDLAGSNKKWGWESRGWKGPYGVESLFAINPDLF